MLFFVPQFRFEILIFFIARADLYKAKVILNSTLGELPYIVKCIEVIKCVLSNLKSLVKAT